MQRLAFERLDRIEGRRGPDRPEIVAFAPSPGMIKAEAGLLEEMRTGVALVKAHGHYPVGRLRLRSRKFYGAE